MKEEEERKEKGGGGGDLFEEGNCDNFSGATPSFIKVHLLRGREGGVLDLYLSITPYNLTTFYCTLRSNIIPTYVYVSAYVSMYI